MARKRKLTAEEKRNLSEKMKARWAAKREEPKPTLDFRFVVFGNNPNTGATEVLEDFRCATMTDAVPKLLDLVYGSGLVLDEIRIERVQ